jgi:hypothetical protein
VGTGGSPAGQRTCLARTAYRGSDPTPCGAALRTIIPRSSGVTSSSVTNLLRSDDTEARHSQGEPATATERLEAGSCSPAMLDVINLPEELRHSIETGNQIHTCLALQWNETKDETPLEKRFGWTHENRRQVWWLSPDDRNWFRFPISLKGCSLATRRAERSPHRYIDWGYYPAESISPWTIATHRRASADASH